MSIPKRVVKAVLDRDEHRCVLRSFGCLQVASAADHRVGRGMGGNPALDVLVNLVAACGICNGLKEDDAPFRRECARRGIHIKRSQSTVKDLERAAGIPVLYPDGLWRRLTPTGREKLRPDEVRRLGARYGLEMADEEAMKGGGGAERHAPVYDISERFSGASEDQTALRRSVSGVR